MPKGTSTTKYSSTSPQYNSPNVVSSNQVNSSMGGSWNQTSGSAATASNASAGISIIAGGGGTYFYSGSTGTPLTTYAMPGYNQMIEKMPFLSLQGSDSSSVSGTPFISSPTTNSSAISGMTSLEFAVFQPTSGKGIVTVGYISERSQTEITHIWNVLNLTF